MAQVPAARVHPIGHVRLQFHQRQLKVIRDHIAAQTADTFVTGSSVLTRYGLDLRRPISRFSAEYLSATSCAGLSMTRFAWFFYSFQTRSSHRLSLDRLFESLVLFLEDVSRRTTVTVTMVGSSRGIQSLLESYAEPS